MPTDLTTVSDHPANLLKVWTQDYFGGKVPMGNRLAADLGVAEQSLRDYEVQHQVTFASLDNDTLTEIREAYANDDDAGLRRLVNDLLGLDDYPPPN